MGSTRRGVREVPSNVADSLQLRNFLMDLRQAVVDLHQPRQPMVTPTNFKVTPQAQGNLLQWTRSNGDFYEVLWNTTPSLNGATSQQVGDSAQWTDQIGNAGTKRYYWVRARRYHGDSSLEAGPVAGTALAAGTNVTPPPPPIPSQNIGQFGPTGHNIPLPPGQYRED